MEGVNTREFIQGVLIQEIGEIQKQHHYLSFGLITQGIEFLGFCLFNDELHKDKQSEKRFRRAISELFPPEYKPYNCGKAEFDLYKNLRCGLLHVVVPESNIELIQEAEKSKFKGSHLDVVMVRGRKRLLLVSQDFYSDFKEACLKIMSRIDAGVIVPKDHGGYLLGFQP
jgi:hypothetical protein